MKNISTVAIMATMLLANAGCKKDTTDPPATTTPVETAVDATVRMKFSFNDGQTPFTLNSTQLVDSLGNHVKLDSVRFFVSGIHAFDDEGNVLAHYEGTYLLVDASLDSNNYAVGAVHASHIHEFHFDLGVEIPANTGLTPPPLDDASMFFNTTMGHKFLVAKGMADHGGDGNFDIPVDYMCGMDMLLTDAHAHVHHDLTENEVFTAQITVNLHGLLNGINLMVDNAPTMASAPSIRIMQNLSDGIDGVE